MTADGDLGPDRSATTVNGGGDSKGLSVANASVRYPGRRAPALDDVSVQVARGEMVGVVGRTGAGKSTLALAAAGFIPRVVRARTSGQVRLDGIDVLSSPARELAGRVGIVFSTPANQLSASKLTVREELAFGLENLGTPRGRMDPMIDSAMAQLGIAHLAEREPFSLSGGEQQRVAIASMVAMGTDFLVLDEPTAQLDPSGTRMVADLLIDLTADGRGILCAEHAPVVLGQASRCTVLDQGRTVAMAPPGVALGPDVLGPIGLPPPTTVLFAWLAGLAPALAFDEDAIALRLREQIETRSPGLAERLDAVGTPTTVETSTWEPIRSVPPGLVEARSITYRYPGGIDALRGVDLAVAPGDAIAIVGQNGSGKTTLAKHLNGLLRPTEGSVRVDGNDIAREPVSSVARRVGFVFQNPDDQLFSRSVDQEVGFGPRNLQLPQAVVAALVDRAVSLTGLTDERTENPYDLGPSRRKLVALASVLAMDPAVLVLDEPTTGQDGPGVERVGAIIETWVAAGRSVVAITHDMEFAASHFRRIVVMHDGVILLEGPPEDIFRATNEALLTSAGLARPSSARIASTIGFEGIVTDTGLLGRLRVALSGDHAIR